ncbi:tetratricopeptide repeat protein [Reichenbachiella ulvae]|uniref:Tetratricopeptide repeat-containing protein n=1 Tax=Reichenbachiella ulvae TaxID=2980104 RepID=A0ABT3CXT9_9BACT|nr:tetratricopeptide repeat protein [Reichenbachiella ulvae]MCV9388510.1 hypothetical protein [Reichenbachiella ulvae]
MRIILLLLLLGPQCWAQEPSQLSGSWIKTSSQTHDGTVYTEADDNHFRYTQLKFSESQLRILTHPMYEHKGACYNYYFTDQKIFLSPTHYYEIIGLSEDQLVIRDRTGTEDGKTLHTFIRAETHHQAIHQSQVQSEYRVARYGYTPTLKFPLEQMLDSALTDLHDNIQIKGTIMIDVSNQSVFTSIAFSSTRDTDWLKYLKKNLDQSYPLWDINGFEGAKIIQVPFVLQDVKTEDYEGVVMAFLTQSLVSLHEPLRRQQRWWANEYFAQAIEAHQNKFKNRAIKLFDKSLELNAENPHALFCRANVYLDKGDEDKACKDWKVLLDQGYEGAMDYYKDNCQNAEALAESDKPPISDDPKAIL